MLIVVFVNEANSCLTTSVRVAIKILRARNQNIEDKRFSQHRVTNFEICPNRIKGTWVVEGTLPIVVRMGRICYVECLLVWREDVIVSGINL